MKRGDLLQRDVKIVKKDVRYLEKELGLIEKRLWRFAFHFHYKKLFLLVILSIFSYIIFRSPQAQGFVSSFGELEYLGVFIAGMLFTFGFTTPFAIGFFVVLNPVNPLLVALVGGAGAVIGDLAIFSLIRFSFMDEFKRLERTTIIKEIRKEMKMHLSHKIRLYVLYAFAGLIIASPLPDEVGVIMLAGLTHIKPEVMIALSFMFNSLGIFIICLL